MIEKLNIQDFDSVYHIMETSFPIDEYRPYAEQKELLNDPHYSVYVICNEARSIIAFIALWDFDDFAYIEHFAVNSEYRNGGIGANILNETVKKLQKLICLEVEPPDTEIATRRIGFYKRNNFFLNPYPYMQPPISRGKKSVPLQIMTYGNKIDMNTFEKIKSALYTFVYKCL